MPSLSFKYVFKVLCKVYNCVWLNLTASFLRLTTLENKHPHMLMYNGGMFSSACNSATVCANAPHV
jgi:hypothetical protein